MYRLFYLIAHIIYPLLRIFITIQHQRSDNSYGGYLCASWHLSNALQYSFQNTEICIYMWLVLVLVLVRYKVNFTEVMVRLCLQIR